eukprot:gnl/Dysnectes_brevis/3803_a4892_407.p1 GENE.gnl/Dysnectes_brevis/3803_a4892_407~~gnl/Dysnectes_brevis/3803_a4892_407.p1  ORF type:complete len:420 (-),score=83.58 gnl/Dysnectes_brevis/3803_a4892_407:87-1346(-)
MSAQDERADIEYLLRTSSFFNSSGSKVNLIHHKHSHRFMPYRYEEFESTDEENHEINRILESNSSLTSFPVSFSSTPERLTNTQIFIDTDLGTDADDSLALLYALKHPRIHILGISTCYGPTHLRAELVSLILQEGGRPDIPVYAGSPFPLGTHRPIYLTGREGVPFIPEARRKQLLDPMRQAHVHPAAASDALARLIIGADRHTTLVSIGIPTNLALAFDRHPTLPEAIHEVVVMGGGSIVTREVPCTRTALPAPCYGLPESSDAIPEWIAQGNPVLLYPNHNMSGDVEGSRRLFSHPTMRVRVVPHDVTRRFGLREEMLDAAKSTTGGVEGVVATLLSEWVDSRHARWQTLHDPLAVHEAVACAGERHVGYVRGTFVVHEWAAYMTFIPGTGPHLLGVDTVREDEFVGKVAEAFNSR